MLEAGYEIYDLTNPQVKYYFDKSISNRNVEDVNMQKNENRLELKTFGKFPYIYYAGHTNYRVFDLTTVFTDIEVGDLIDDGNNGYKVATKRKSYREQVDEFKKMLMKRIPLIIRNTQNQYFVCDVELTSEVSPKLNIIDEFLNYVEITVKCTELADYFNRINVRHVGSGSGYTSVAQNNQMLGRGSGGNEVQYSIMATYGNPLNLEATSYDGKFIRWKINNATVKDPDNFIDFFDEMTLDAVFEKVVNINIYHKGSGAGKTSVYQDKQLLGKGEGGLGTSYVIKAMSGQPIGFEQLANEMSRFVRWEDKWGNKIASEYNDFSDGDDLYAVFESKKGSIRVRYLDSVTKKPLKPDKILRDQSGIVNVRGDIIDKYILLDPKTQTVTITKEKEYLVEFYYKRDKINITIKHIGTGSGYTKASQSGQILGSGRGNHTVSYNIEIDPNKNLELYGEPDQAQGQFVPTFLGFEYENGTKVQLNDRFEDGTIIYAVFDIKIDHDFDWLFTFTWDESLVDDRRVDMDMYAILDDNLGSKEYVYYSNKKISSNNGSIELDIDNTRGGSYGLSPEVITINGSPCRKVSIRVAIFSGEGNINSGISPMKLSVHKKGERWNEHIKDYFINASNFTSKKSGYYICDVYLDTGELVDVNRPLPNGAVGSN